ncbi:MAG: hypothetical protein ABI895_21075 [Deltaproteobacteria bacterium]
MASGSRDWKYRRQRAAVNAFDVSKAIRDDGLFGVALGILCPEPLGLRARTDRVGC